MRKEGLLVAAGLLVSLAGLEFSTYVSCRTSDDFLAIRACTYPVRPVGWGVLAAGLVLAAAGLVLLWRRSTSAGSPSSRVPPTAILVVVGLATLAVANHLPWWQLGGPFVLTLPSGNVTVDTAFEFVPGAYRLFGCTVSPPDDPAWGPICNLTASQGGRVPEPYPAALSSASNTGGLYGPVGLVAYGGLASGAIGLFLLPRTGAASRRRRIVGVVLVALAAAGFLAIALSLPAFHPAALAADGQMIADGPSPDDSFWGSCQGPDDGLCFTAGTRTAWGAGPGWYLAWVGAALVVAGALRARRPPTDVTP